MSAPDFPETYDNNTRANLCKIFLKPATTKNNNGAVVTRKCFVQHRQKQQLHLLKKLKKGEYKTC